VFIVVGRRRKTGMTVEDEARYILDCLASQAFNECQPVNRDFAGMTTKGSIYAVRHRTDGILYVGKTQNPKNRFAAGHKALVWCWFQGYMPADVRIAVYSLDWQKWTALSLELENQIIRATEPPFNVKIPMGE
jgi:predicted GIY-YIG superfamily endonuclease